MISVICINCSNYLDEPGGLLFSPPNNENVKKYHLCLNCYNDVIHEILSGNLIGK